MKELGQSLKAFFYTESGRLRVSHEEQSSLPAVAPHPILQKRYKVFIVDDSKVIRDSPHKNFLGRSSLGSGWMCGAPLSGGEMLAALKPDVMTLDIHNARNGWNHFAQATSPTILSSHGYDHFHWKGRR